MMIVFIHAVFPGVFGQAVQAAARYAVPLFFAMSGYFFMEGADPDRDSIRRRVMQRLRRLIPLTAGIWSVYTVYACCIRVTEGGTPASLLQEKFAPAEILRFLAFNAGRVVYDPEYTFDHLWYLFAMAYVYIFMYLAAGSMKRIHRPVCLFLMAMLCACSALQVIRPISLFGISIRTWYVLRNWLLEGIPFFLAGYGIRRIAERDEADRVFPGPAAAYAAAAAAAFCLQTVEFYLTGTREIYFSSIPAAVLTVIAAAKDDSMGIRPLEYAGRLLASKIYYWHVLVYSLFTRCFAYFYLRALPGMGEGERRFWNGVYPYFLPVIILGITAAAAALSVRLREIRKSDR